MVQGHWFPNYMYFLFLVYHFHFFFWTISLPFMTCRVAMNIWGKLTMRRKPGGWISFPTLGIVKHWVFLKQLLCRGLTFKHVHRSQFQTWESLLMSLFSVPWSIFQKVEINNIFRNFVQMIRENSLFHTSSMSCLNKWHAWQSLDSICSHISLCKCILCLKYYVLQTLKQHPIINIKKILNLVLPNNILILTILTPIQLWNLFSLHISEFIILILKERRFNIF